MMEQGKGNNNKGNNRGRRPYYRRKKQQGQQQNPSDAAGINNDSNTTVTTTNNKEELLKLSYRLVNTKELSLINKNDKVFIYKVIINKYQYKLSIPTSSTGSITLSTLIINAETMNHNPNVIRNFNSKFKNGNKDVYTPLFCINYLINNYDALCQSQQSYKNYETNKLL